MTDSQDNNPDGALGDGLSDDVLALLADPRMWVETPMGMSDRVAAVVRSETPTPARAPDSFGRTRRPLPQWARPALLGAAAVLFVFFGGVAFFSSIDDTSGRSRLAVLVPTGLVPAVQGEAEFEETDAGVSIALAAPSLPPLEGESFYEGWVHTMDGHAIPVGTFHQGDEVELWAAVDLDEVQEFTVTREHAEEPASAEHRSSGEVVLTATIDPVPTETVPTETVPTDQEPTGTG
jgi:hypothetical protein